MDNKTILRKIKIGLKNKDINHINSILKSNNNFDLNYQDKNGNSTFFNVINHIDNIDIKIFDYFLKNYEINLNLKNSFGNTPLHKLASKNNINEFDIQSLINYGADFLIYNKEGISPIHILLKNKNYHQNKILELTIFEDLFKHKENTKGNCFVHELFNGNLENKEFIKFIIENNLSLNIENKKG